MICHLEIHRTTGIERRNIDPQGHVGVAEGACPGCGATPFLVQGQGAHAVNRDTLRANGIAKCCGDAVGYVFARVDTFFGLEEDIAVRARARVY